MTINQNGGPVSTELDVYEGPTCHYYDNEVVVPPNIANLLEIVLPNGSKQIIHIETLDPISWIDDNGVRHEICNRDGMPPLYAFINGVHQFHW